MDQAFVKHIADNPNAGRARPRGPVVVTQPQPEQKSAAVAAQERYLRQSERERYEMDTRDLRAAGKPVPPFVCSLDIKTGEMAEGVVRDDEPRELTPAEKAAATRAKKKAAKELADTKEEAESDSTAGAAAEAFAALEKVQADE